MKANDQQPAEQAGQDKAAKPKPAPSENKPDRKGAENIKRYKVGVI